MKFKSIVLLIMSSSQCLNGIMLKCLIGETVCLRNFSVTGYIRNNKELFIRAMLREFDVGNNPEDYWPLFISLDNIAKNQMLYPPGFSEKDYMYLIDKTQTPGQIFVLRGLKPGSIDAAADEPVLPNFNIKNPNFVVIDSGDPKIVINQKTGGFFDISFPKFLWNVTTGQVVMPANLRTTIEAVYAALSSQTMTSEDNQSLPELFNQMLFLGI